MIVLTVEVHPHGDASRKRELARVIIANDGTGTEKRGNYVLRALRRGSLRVQRSGVLRNWPRKSQPVLSFIKQALDALGY